MFLDEAQLLARISHPAIAQIYDFGEDQGTLFLAMEYVAGVPFRDLIARRVLPAQVSARAMADALRGLHAAHELTDLGGQQLAVVHRDVSPDNLMLTFEGQVKVLDFGIALMRGRQAPVTELGTIKGKPPYLSPEQIKNQPIDRRTDIFAAGVVLHEMLTSERLFAGESLLAVARAIEMEPIAPPSQSAGALPRGLDEAVMTALERDPEKRWPTALGFARALDAAAAGGETLADFAGRVLFLERERHREWLGEVLSAVGTRLSLPRGRPSGVVTAQAADAELPRVTARRPKVGAAGRRPAVLLVGVSALAALTLVLWAIRLTRGGDQRDAVDAAPADAAPAIAAAATPAADAAPAPRYFAPPPPPVTRRKAIAREHRAASPPPAARPPVEDKDPGTITVTVLSGSYADVAIDGKPVPGGTPIYRMAIDAGQHEVVLTDPASGKVRYRKTVTVEPAKLSKVNAP
jgi:serine/threonine-protein kinase